ncbi:MAG: DUF4147 domain-containing protein, partial [Alphaproteobacteria bacterium]|nr:DUF4147 domain-containing protein [Alphaproteobacteria bacterium]
VDSIAVTNRENQSLAKGVTCYVAGHPLPDPEGLKSAEAVMAAIDASPENCHVILCISGGASAMLPAPVEGVSLQEKIKTTDLLLGSGADIVEINVVRKHLSRLKGGGLLRLAGARPVSALILSDVINNDLSAIASGPATADITSFEDAKFVMEKYDIWEASPRSVRRYIADGIEGKNKDTLKPNETIGLDVRNHLIGSNHASVSAARHFLKSSGVELLDVDYPIIGDVREAAKKLAEKLMQHLSDGNVKEGQKYALVSGGETTVQLTGSGKGGRNQEFTLAFVKEMSRRQNIAADWVFFSGGTDGRDGPTDAAGGLVDCETMARLVQAGRDIDRDLANNNAYAALKDVGDLIRIGGTGTNVADVQILIF